MKFEYVKIVVFVPKTHGNIIRETLAESGAGHIGNYDYCSFSVEGVGRFRPLNGSDPFIGTAGKVEEVIEERIETVCEFEKYKEIVEKIREAHPYEEVVIDVYPLLDVN